MNAHIFGGSGGIGQALASATLDGQYLSSSDVDVRCGEAVREWFEANRPDVVINAAVVNHDAVLHKSDPDEVTEQIRVSCVGLTNILRHCLPYMREQGYGRVIHLSSVLSRSPVVGTGVYAACKAYTEALVRNAAVENAGKGVTVNAIRLGYFDAGLKDRMPAEMQDAVLRSIPAGRWGSIGELARTIDWLTETAYVNGATIDLTGGL